MSKRLFVSIDLPASVEKVLVDLDPGIHGVRWVPGNQMHITLGFFPDVAQAVELALHEKLNAIEFRAFFLPIAGIGTFPPKGVPKIIWIGVGHGHPHLFQLHKRVQEAALGVGLEADLRPWHPHVTLARCQDVSGGEFPRFLKPMQSLMRECFESKHFIFIAAS